MGDVDAVHFEELAERARQASGSPGVAELWRQAMDLWCSPAFGAFADLESITPAAHRPEELRAAATAVDPNGLHLLTADTEIAHRELS